ncbi:hypothetical protein [Streptomyces sp. NPDC055134]
MPSTTERESALNGPAYGADEEGAVDLSALAERLDKSLFAVEYPPELEDGSVVDAEVVD